jgi:hypothetical protein
MRKKLVLLLLLKLSGLLLPKVYAQSQLSLEHYYAGTAGSPTTMMPIASFQAGKGFYTEARYNYEELNTMSLYMGRTISKESKLSYSVSPMAGVVVGNLNGGSVGMNVSLGYKNFYLYSQPQYTFSVENCFNNYIYSWTDLTYSPSNWLSVGLSLQHTKPYGTRSYMENGLVVEVAYRHFTFPVYFFNPLNKSRSIVLGTNLELNFRKRKKKKEQKTSEPYREEIPMKVIAKLPEKKEGEEKPKPDSGPVIKVRRVNVIVQPKSTGPETPEPVIKKEPEKTITPSEQKEEEKAEKLMAVAKPKHMATKHPEPSLKAAAVEVKPARYHKAFALLLGPFVSQQEALSVQNKLSEISNREAILYSEGSRYRLRISGFRNLKEAESFVLILSNDFVTESTIISYQLKNIDAIPLKNSPKDFEATQLK